MKQGGSRQGLEKLTDRELLKKASRETLIVINLVYHTLRPQLLSLLAGKQTETATLLNAIVAGLRAATIGLEQFQHIPDGAGRGAKDGLKSDDARAIA